MNINLNGTPAGMHSLEPDDCDSDRQAEIDEHQRIMRDNAGYQIVGPAVLLPAYDPDNRDQLHGVYEVWWPCIHDVINDLQWVSVRPDGVVVWMDELPEARDFAVD